eukprot:GHVN01022719.1.p1 GENE.GHVN01022719.1~~GHVN01022719.1.p1  ORF type:complete len:433 (+),score=29.83 GHVN01022719.1:597-1895(+)
MKKAESAKSKLRKYFDEHIKPENNEIEYGDWEKYWTAYNGTNEFNALKKLYYERMFQYYQNASKQEPTGACDFGEDGANIYFFGAQPLMNLANYAVDKENSFGSAELLMRQRNHLNSTTAPFNDFDAIQVAKNDSLDKERKDYNQRFVFTQITHVVTQFLNQWNKVNNPLPENFYFSANLRREDIVDQTLLGMVRDHGAGTLNHVGFELLEHQAYRAYDTELEDAILKWKELGLVNFSLDDGMSKLLCTDEMVLTSEEKKTIYSIKNCNHNLQDLLYEEDYRKTYDSLDTIKMDINYLGHVIFPYTHPAYPFQIRLDEQIADWKGNLENLESHLDKPIDILLFKKKTKHLWRDYLEEFAKNCLKIIGDGKSIALEITINQKSPGVNLLKNYGLDIFGTHAEHFKMQGGQTGAVAFDPWTFAGISGVKKLASD